jgi:hypothetical protein
MARKLLKNLLHENRAEIWLSGCWEGAIRVWELNRCDSVNRLVTYLDVYIQ